MNYKLDIVVNKKENNQILYKITKEYETEYEVVGVNYRIKKIVEKDLLIEANQDIIKKENFNKKDILSYMNIRGKKYKGILGTILHIDTDSDYIRKCIDLYKSVEIYAYPILSKESDLSLDIEKLKLDFIPDVIVITGHDYFNGNNKKDINDYLNSKNFADAVLVSRKKYPNSIIIAGACQSLFEVLIARGANFASSPKRKNIHIYDPAIIAIYSCITPQKEIIDFNKMEKYIEGFESAFGGVETYGKMKLMY